MSKPTHWVIVDQNGRTCRPHYGAFDSRLRHHKALECVCLESPMIPIGPRRSVHLPETRELREEGDVGDEEATATKARCSGNGNHPQPPENAPETQNNEEEKTQKKQLGVPTRTILNI